MFIEAVMAVKALMPAVAIIAVIAAMVFMANIVDIPIKAVMANTIWWGQPPPQKFHTFHTESAMKGVKSMGITGRLTTNELIRPLLN